MKALILILLISLSGCSTVADRYSENKARQARDNQPWVKPATHLNKYGYEVYEDGTYVNRSDKTKADSEEYDRYQKSVGAPTLAERNQVKAENPQQTACIYFGNAYVQAINIRNQWGFQDAKATHEAILSHVQAILVNYPQFNSEGIVDNVLYNPALRPPVGGNPFLLQMVQLCMQETKRVATKP